MQQKHGTSNHFSCEVQRLRHGSSSAKHAQPRRASSPHLGNERSCLDTERRGPEKLRLRIGSAIRPDGHPIHIGETRHCGQVVCRSSKAKIVNRREAMMCSDSSVDDMLPTNVHQRVSQRQPEAVSLWHIF